MNHGGRFALLTSAVVLLLVGVVCLRQQGRTDVAPAFVPGKDGSATPRGKSVNRQPTILSADPNSESGVPHSSWRDPSVIPVPEVHPSWAPTYPIRADAALPGEPSGVPSLLPPAGGDLRAVPPPLENSETSPPSAAVESSAPPSDAATEAEAPSESLRTLTLRTRPNDSLWLISERAYGQGLYYQALFAFNRARIVRPDRLAEGLELLIPPVEELQRLFPDLCPSGS